MTAVLLPEPSAAIEHPIAAKKAKRRTDIDGLRIVICASIILAHAMLIFAAEPLYHLKSQVPTLSASIAYEFVHLTSLPVFFVIGGWAAVLSVRKRGAIYFPRERIVRLVVPLAFGMATVCPIIKYIELRNGRDLSFNGLRLVENLKLNYFEFLPRYFTRTVLMTWSHLWFLAYLFVISILLLPLLVWLARRVPRTEVPNVLLVYLPAFVLAVWLAVSNGYWPFKPNLLTDGNNLVYYALCFAFGAGMSAWPGFELRMQCEAPRLFVMMLVTFAGVIWYGESTVGRLLVGLTAWAAVVTALGFAARFQPRQTAAFEYLCAATMPVYILHHPLLLLIASVVLPLDFAVWPKIALIATATSIVSVLAYHWLVRPWPPVRWLMGMGYSRA